MSAWIRPSTHDKPSLGFSRGVPQSRALGVFLELSIQNIYYPQIIHRLSTDYPQIIHRLSTWLHPHHLECALALPRGLCAAQRPSASVTAEGQSQGESCQTLGQGLPWQQRLGLLHTACSSKRGCVRPCGWRGCVGMRHTGAISRRTLKVYVLVRAREREGRGREACRLLENCT